MKPLLLATLCLTLASCSGDPVTQALEAAVDAAIAADSILRPQDAPYLTLATGCMDGAASVLETTGLTPLQQAGQIAQQCAAAVAGETGAPVTVQAVIAALNAFLKVVEPKTTAPVAWQSVLTRSQANSFFETKNTAAKHLDMGRLHRIQKKLKQLKKK